MPIVHISAGIMADNFVMDAFLSAFDYVYIIANSRETYKIRVEHKELPQGDYIITPVFHKFHGVKPICIDWGLPPDIKPIL